MPIKNLKRLTAYLKPQIYQILEKVAEEEERTVSQLAARLLEEILRIKGKLPPDEESQ